ncbi:outer membrane beta-barrel protein [Devosia sp. ZB163]|uniref:outer membrane protein n=1 Tax=Devosia sp. ZB163 TaxID=3025938 RepID=UPI00235DCC55|nr:outer membrane beta-barrel protein [Devosia sp. ZB163]MDC9824024.1 outer membrane beta-barrel protein [Devosia sp. ZB163]
MVKRLLSVATVAAAVSMAGAATAADLIVDAPVEAVTASEPGDWYVSLFAGGVWAPGLEGDYYDNTYDIDTDTGYMLGVAVGTKVFDALRVELELSGGSSGINEVSDPDDVWADFDGSVSTLYLLGNLWYDLDVGGGITPYVGGGVGLGHANIDFTDWNWEVSGTGLAFQIGAGVQFEIASGIALDLGYRYKAMPGLTLEDEDDEPLDVNIGSHVVQAGLTFSF